MSHVSERRRLAACYQGFAFLGAMTGSFQPLRRETRVGGNDALGNIALAAIILSPFNSTECAIQFCYAASRRVRAEQCVLVTNTQQRGDERLCSSIY